MKTIILVACASQKRSSKMPAKDIYVSELFRQSKSYVESTGCPWFILSAKYGLLSPEEIIEPYDQTLNKMPAWERRKWAAGILESLKPILSTIERVEIFAGNRYREFIEETLRQKVEVVVPLRGLRIGQQLRWLKRRNRDQAC